VKVKKEKASISIKIVVGWGEVCRGRVKKAPELEKKVEGGWCLSGQPGSDLYKSRGFCILGSDNRNEKGGSSTNRRQDVS